MDTPSALSQELLDAVRTHLDAGNFKEALELPNDNKYAAALKDNCWDLIPYLLSRIDDNTIIRWPALQRCCERLLMVVADRANSEEVILELIEQAEVAKNDAQFIAILKPLQNVLVRLSNKRGRSLEWCFNTLLLYIEKLPTPGDFDLSCREKLLMDCDENGRRIIKIYIELPTFYDYFVDQISTNKKASSIKDIATCFLIDLLGKPFAHLDVEYDGKTKSQPRAIAEQIFKDLCSINEDLYKFLVYIDRKCHPRTKTNHDGVYEDAPADVFLLNEKLSPISLGNLYYLLLVENLPAPMLPQVYSQIYVYQEVLGLTVVLIREESTNLQYKGLKLAKVLFDYLPENSPSSLLSSVDHYALAKSLCTTAVYCPAEFIRKMSVCILKTFIFKFDDKGRYLFVRNLLPNLQHSGIIGYLITLYKDMIMDALQSPDDRLYWFKEKRLYDIVHQICKLKDGVETDIVESADQIISALNLLRFIVLKDIENVTGIWDCMDTIKKGYLETLREGINMSRAHYELKLLDLTDPSISNKENSPKISVSVSGSSLDSLPIENKKEVVNSAFNALHLVDSLLCRLHECLESHP